MNVSYKITFFLFLYYRIEENTATMYVFDIIPSKYYDPYATVVCNENELNLCNVANSKSWLWNFASHIKGHLIKVKVSIL